MLQKLLELDVPDLHFTAMTGIAANHIKGRTLHSFAGIGPKEKDVDALEEVDPGITLIFP